MTELSNILTNPVEAARIYAKYYNTQRFMEDMERRFSVETGRTPGGYAMRVVTLRKNEKGYLLGDREEVTVDDCCFSVTMLYGTLLPQTIAKVLDNAAMYRFHRASGVPMLTFLGNDTLLSPEQTLRESGLFPSDRIIDIYSSFVYNVRAFVRREVESFFGGTRVKEVLDTNAYHILCGTMAEHVDEVWGHIEEELDRIFFPDLNANTPQQIEVSSVMGSDKKQTIVSESAMMVKQMSRARETQAIESAISWGTSSNRSKSLKITPRVSEILDKWNEKMRGMYHVTGDFGVQLMVGLYATRRDSDKDVLDLMRVGQRLNNDLSTILTKDEVNALKQRYLAVANHCFSKAYHPSIIPNKAHDSLVHFLDAQPGMAVLNPFFAAQSFVYRLTAMGCRCEAFEMGTIPWGMSKIYLEARNQLIPGMVQPCMAAYASSIEEMGDNQKYDRIVAYVKDGDQEDFDITLLQWVKHCLQPEGMVGVLLPEAANVATDRWQTLRKRLVEKGMLRGVVRLPDEKDSYTIWLVGHPGEEQPFFCNFEAYAEADDLQADPTPFGQMADPTKCCKVTASKLRSCGYSFHPLRYLPMAQDEEGKTTTLGKLIELKTCELVEEGSGLWVGISGNKDRQPAFSQNPLDCTVDEERLRSKEFTTAVVVPKPSLLAIDHQGTMRVARVPEGLSGDADVHAAARAFVFGLRPNAKCTEDFLLWLIAQPSTNEQVRVLSVMRCREESMQLRYCKSMLMPDDFKAIQVDLPTPTEQLRILESDRRGQLAQLATEQGERFQALERDLSIKRHSIGQTLFKTANWLKLLMEMRKMAGGVLKDDDRIGTQPFTVADVFDELDKDFARLNQKVATLRPNESLESEEFDLRSHCEKFISDHHYDVCTLIKGWSDNDDADYLVNFAPGALVQILENILSNAVSHGFRNIHKTDHAVLFNLERLSDGRAQLTVSNNGAPLNLKGKDPMEYGTTVSPEPDAEKLSKSAAVVHSGIGGYQIRQYMERFGGEAHLDSVPEDDYPVRYRLIFKLLNH